VCVSFFIIWFLESSFSLRKIRLNVPFPFSLYHPKKRTHTSSIMK
jgi:hypothetical protein